MNYLYSESALPPPSHLYSIDDTQTHFCFHIGQESLQCQLLFLELFGAFHDGILVHTGLPVDGDQQDPHHLCLQSSHQFCCPHGTPRNCKHITHLKKGGRKYDSLLGGGKWFPVIGAILLTLNACWIFILLYGSYVKSGELLLFKC